MNTLVTGGAGFIGSHLVDRLIKEGHRVTVLDNLSTGRMENLASSSGAPGFEFQKADTSDPGTIRDYFRNIDWVFHLAALADIVPSIENPLEYHRANVDGTVSVLEAARDAGVKRFIYAASSSCYGIPDTFPTPETAPISPRYPYALTKYLGEECVLHWGELYDLSVVSLRLFNVYGPRSRTSGVYGAVFGTFLAQKIHGKPFTVVGDGNQTRDFLFVTDVIEAFMRAAESKVRNEIFNVGTGLPVSINRLIDLLGGDVVYIPKRPGEPDRTQADIGKITGILKWKPRISFEEGVEILLNNIDYWKDAPLWTPETISEATKGWFKHLGSSKK